MSEDEIDVEGLRRVAEAAMAPRLSSCCFNVGKPECKCRPMAGIEASALMALCNEVPHLTHLLGSHTDGHLCTCEMADGGRPGISPPEWEQDPWCPTHPDMTYVLAAAEALRGQVERVRALRLDDEVEEMRQFVLAETEHLPTAEHLRHLRNEIRAALDGPR